MALFNKRYRRPILLNSFYAIHLFSFLFFNIKRKGRKKNMEKV